MTEQEFIQLCKESKPIEIIDFNAASFGITIVFENGKKVYIEPRTSYDLPYMEFELL